ncbi:MAG: hypothetical protein WAT66_01785 [Actinomycetota bacterium]
MPAKKKTTTRKPRAPRASAPRSKAPPPPEQPAASPFTPGMAPECLMCPFGLVFFTMRNTRPEVMEHLMTAGQELFLAFKALVDQTADRWEQTQSLQRITVR